MTTIHHRRRRRRSWPLTLVVLLIRVLNRVPSEPWRLKKFVFNITFEKINNQNLCTRLSLVVHVKTGLVINYFFLPSSGRSRSADRARYVLRKCDQKASWLIAAVEILGAKKIPNTIVVYERKYDFTKNINPRTSLSDCLISPRPNVTSSTRWNVGAPNGTFSKATHFGEWRV